MTCLRPHRVGKAESLFAVNLKPFSTASTHRRHPGGGKKQVVVRSNDAVCPEPAIITGARDRISLYDWDG
jgi:hypothetical protein